MKASVVVVGVEKTVGQEMDEFEQVIAASRAKAGGQIRNRPPGEKSCRGVQHRVADAPDRARLRANRPRADDEIKGVETRNETRGVRRGMLSVGVDNEDVGTRGPANARFHGGAVALVVRMPNDGRAGLRGSFGGPIGRAVIDDKDFPPTAASLSAATIEPIDGASLNAGMTTVVASDNRVIG
jgi:hypothetical protein